jgi:4-hydroxy-tetrahydrodipicolinate synthase
MIHQAPDPFVAPRGLVDYVARIADVAGDVPLLLYLRDDGIGTAMIEQLCALPTVVGVKWACPRRCAWPRRLRLRSAPDLERRSGRNLGTGLYAVGARGSPRG